MINNKCFTLEWISKVREDNPPADPIIVEKSIYAFEHLSKLCEKDFEFIFKGETSLLLNCGNLVTAEDIIREFEDVENLIYCLVRFKFL